MEMGRVRGKERNENKKDGYNRVELAGWICLIICHSFNGVMAALPRTAARGRKKTGSKRRSLECLVTLCEYAKCNVPSVLCGRIDGSGLA